MGEDGRPLKIVDGNQKGRYRISADVGCGRTFRIRTERNFHLGKSDAHGSLIFSGTFTSELKETCSLGIFHCPVSCERLL
jgi:hypothetical protein